MSMWKTIPTLFGDLADRPAATDVPYGTGWVDENDGLSISDGTVWTDVGGGVAVDDDGTPVVAAASLLNFGDNLTVTDDGGGQVTIDAAGGAVRDGWTLVESAYQGGFDWTTDAGAILAVYRWGVDAGVPYFDNDGVTAGEEAALWLDDNDQYVLVELDL